MSVTACLVLVRLAVVLDVVADDDLGVVPDADMFDDCFQEERVLLYF